MTANQLRYNVLVAVDSLFENAAPGYNDSQMSAILNRAQRRVFRRFSARFDKDEKAKKALSPVIKRASTKDDSISTVYDTSISKYSHSTSSISSKFFRLPSDTAYVVQESLTLDSDIINGVVVTSSTNTVIFEARVANTEFIGGTTIVNITTNLSGTVATTVAAAPGVKRKDVITLSGSSGTALITCNGVSRVITYSTSLNLTASNFASYKYSDYYYSGGYGNITDPVIVLPITYDYFLKNYNNSYKKPYEKLVWRLDTTSETFSSTKYYVSEIMYPDTYAIEDYDISYLRNPNDMVVFVAGTSTDCEIRDQAFQDEIIGEAVKIIVAALNDGDYQTAALDKKFDE